MIYFLCNLLLVSLQNVRKKGRGNRRQQLKLEISATRKLANCLWFEAGQRCLNGPKRHYEL